MCVRGAGVGGREGAVRFKWELFSKTYTCTHINAHAHKDTHVCVLVRVHTNTQTCEHVHTHTRTHTHTERQREREREYLTLFYNTPKKNPSPILTLSDQSPNK